MKVNILGTEYDFAEGTKANNAKLYSSAGYCDNNSKEIRYDSDMEANHPDASNNPDAFLRYVKRHELIHAFLYESGWRDRCDDETLVDWIAIQFPKILKVFQEIEAL